VAIKTATLTVRIEPGLKSLLKKAAETEHRSIANMIEVLIKRHADENGLLVDQASERVNYEITR
jgi:hypothetical protein